VLRLHNMKSLSAKLLLLVTSVVLLFIVISTFSSRHQTFSNSEIEFDYPVGYVELEPSESTQNQATMVVKLAIKSPIKEIVLAKESNVTVAATRANARVIDLLESNAESSLPTIYNKFKKNKVERITISEREAVRINFSYMGKDETTILYTDFIIIPYKNDAYYLTVQSTDPLATYNDSKLIRSSFKLSY